MKNFIFAIIFLTPLFGKTQSSKSPLVDIIIASIATDPANLKDIIKIDPYKFEKDKIYYYLTDIETTFIKGITDGSATYYMPYSENLLKEILYEFTLRKFSIESEDDKLFVANSKLFFFVYEQESKIIIFGMEHSKVPK